MQTTRLVKLSTNRHHHQETGRCEQGHEIREHHKNLLQSVDQAQRSLADSFLIVHWRRRQRPHLNFLRNRMSLSNAYQEPSQHSDQSSILFGEEALCENQGGASMSGADFHANAAPAPQGALESNQRAPVVSRGRTSELLFVDPSGRAVEGRRVIVELSRLWPKRSPPHLTPSITRRGSSSEGHSGHRRQRLVAHASCGLGFSPAVIGSSHQAARAKPAWRTRAYF
jgi:hypothetical protein